MTIIVTGGAGFIGSNFIFHMLDKYPDYQYCLLRLLNLCRKSFNTGDPLWKTQISVL